MIVVDIAGRGDFTSVQAAFDAARAGERIFIRRGVYREKLRLLKDNITLIGEDARETLLIYGDSASTLLKGGERMETFLSYTLLITGNCVTIEDITVENDAGDGRRVGQAVALYAAGDRLTARRCRFIAHQDTLFCGPTFPKVAKYSGGYDIPIMSDSPADGETPDHAQYYEDCEITGDVDFIFGSYRCFFEGCALIMNDRGMDINGYYTAASTPEGREYGFVFHRCALTGRGKPETALLGRPWRRHARTDFINCDMDECVAPAGWADWADKPVTKKYREYGTTGAGGDTAMRHAGAKLLTREQAAEITRESVLYGWQPDVNGGVSPRAVEAFLDCLKNRQVDMHGFIITRNGEPLWEGYWSPFEADKPHRLYSISKTLTALGIGLLTGDGRLTLNDSICDYFPEYVSDKTPDEVLRTTIRDMLEMRTPYTMSTYRRSDDNWTRPFFESKPSHEAGTAFFYDTSASQVLCALVEKLAGKPITEFLRERLLSPLGCDGETRWLTDGAGVSQGGTGLIMALRDVARVAYCVMEDGAGLLPAEFVRDMKRLHALTDMQSRSWEREGYGLHIWRGKHGSFVMYGMGGQMAFILPRQRLIVCTTADTRLRPITLDAIYEAVYEHLVPNVSAPGGDKARLRERLKNLSVEPSPHGERFGKWQTDGYDIAPNPSGITWLRLGEDALIYRDEQGERRLPFGVGRLELATLPDTDQPCLVSGGMLSENNFLLKARLIGDNPCGVEMLFAFKGNAVTVNMRDSFDDSTMRYRGTLRGVKDNLRVFKS